MLLGHHDGAGLSGGLGDNGGIQRLDGMDIDHTDRDTASLLEGRGGIHGGLDHHTRGNNGQIPALCQGLALTGLKGIGIGIVQDRHGVAAEADIEGAVGLDGVLQGGGGLHGVGGVDDGHAGDHAHDGQILQALMGRAVLTHGDARVGSADLDVEMGVGHAVADLLKGTSGGEHGEGGGYDGLTGGGKACGDTDHIALGDTAIKEAVGIRLGEIAGLGGFCQVGVQHHEIAVGAQLHKGLTVGLTGCDLISKLEFHGSSLLTTVP